MGGQPGPWGQGFRCPDACLFSMPCLPVQMFLVTLRKDGVSYSLRLHEYDEAQGGGRLNKESTLGELQLGTLKIKYDEVHGYVPVSFDADGYSRDRIRDGATYDASGRGEGTGWRRD
jgi:hypothetical protein